MRIYEEYGVIIFETDSSHFKGAYPKGSIIVADEGIQRIRVINLANNALIISEPYNTVFKEDGVTNYGGTLRDTIRELNKLFSFQYSTNTGIADDKTLRVTLDTNTLNTFNGITNGQSAIAGVLNLANWQTIPFNTTNISYFTGIVPANPSGNTNNIEKIEYANASGLVLTQFYTYNSSDNIIKIETV